VVFATTACACVSTTVASSTGAAPAPPPVSRWAQLRALLLTVVLLVQCTSALPDRRVEKRNLRRPEAARFLDTVERGLQRIGLSPDRRALEQALLAGSARLVRARRALLAPFQPLFRYTATHQQWGLFLLGTRECFRIHVDARTHDDRWVALYHALERGLPRYEAVLRYRRVRGIYNPSMSRGARPQYRGFVRAFARYVLEREPGYDTVRVRMEHLRIGDPGSVPLSSGFEHEQVVHRSELWLEPAGSVTRTRGTGGTGRAQ
jgi:hypothetical protein